MKQIPRELYSKGLIDRMDSGTRCRKEPEETPETFLARNL